jgi:hypothetical protein
LKSSFDFYFIKNRMASQGDPTSGREALARLKQRSGKIAERILALILQTTVKFLLLIALQRFFKSITQKHKRGGG